MLAACQRGLPWLARLDDVVEVSMRPSCEEARLHSGPRLGAQWAEQVGRLPPEGKGRAFHGLIWASMKIRAAMAMKMRMAVVIAGRT